jgi:hypothetical protein
MSNVKEKLKMYLMKQAAGPGEMAWPGLEQAAGAAGRAGPPAIPSSYSLPSDLLSKLRNAEAPNVIPGTTDTPDILEGLASRMHRPEFSGMQQAGMAFGKGMDKMKDMISGAPQQLGQAMPAGLAGGLQSASDAVQSGGSQLMEAAKDNPQLAALLMGLPLGLGGVALKRKLMR